MQEGFGIVAPEQLGSPKIAIAKVVGKLGPYDGKEPSENRKSDLYRWGDLVLETPPGSDTATAYGLSLSLLRRLPKNVEIFKEATNASRSPATTAPAGGLQSAGGRNRITFLNRSGSDALVKLVGAALRKITVPNGSNSSVNVPAGTYNIKIRYELGRIHSYALGDPFEIVETPTSISDVTITLHPVVGGNYTTHPLTQTGFDADAH